MFAFDKVLIFFLWVFGVGEVGEFEDVFRMEPFWRGSLADVGGIGRVGIVGEFLGKFLRVEMDVFREVEKLFFGFDKNIFIPALKESTRVLVLFLKIHGVSDHDTTHEIGDGGFSVVLIDEKVKMIGH